MQNTLLIYICRWDRWIKHPCAGMRSIPLFSRHRTDPLWDSEFFLAEVLCEAVVLVSIQCDKSMDQNDIYIYTVIIIVNLL